MTTLVKFAILTKEENYLEIKLELGRDGEVEKILE